jgi:DNA repair photolyase
MGQVHYEEIQAASALNRVENMGFRWSLNPYRGCVHECHYCFARRYHSLFDLDPGSDFASVVMVKNNLPDLLRRELSRPGWRHETVAVGTATDPYQPIEGKYRITRRCLEVFADFYTPIGLVTKGTMAVRDVDVLSELSNRAGCTVCFSVTTLNRDIWSRLEPGTPPPRQRLKAMERLVSGGVNAGVLLAPVVPGITDDRANLEEVAREAAAHGARFLGTNVLYLKSGTKEHFMEFLEHSYPNLTNAYRNIYPSSYAPRKLQDRVRLRVQEFKVKYGLEDIGEAGKADMQVYGQKTLVLSK